jgi:hypothetical protein
MPRTRLSAIGTRARPHQSSVVTLACTANLFGALNVPLVKLQRTLPRGADQKGLSAFMKTVAAKYVDHEVNIAVNNLDMHFAAEVHDWLTDNSMIPSYRAPVGVPWINRSRSGSGQWRVDTGLPQSTAGRVMRIRTDLPHVL